MKLDSEKLLWLTTALAGVRCSDVKEEGNKVKQKKMYDLVKKNVYLNEVHQFMLEAKCLSGHTLEVTALEKHSDNDDNVAYRTMRAGIRAENCVKSGCALLAHCLIANYTINPEIASTIPHELQKIVLDI